MKKKGYITCAKKMRKRQMHVRDIDSKGDLNDLKALNFLFPSMYIYGFYRKYWLNQRENY